MVWRVKPLSVDPDISPGAASQAVPVIPDAIRLFLDRALGVAPQRALE
jgi:hypothetical protein